MKRPRIFYGYWILIASMVFCNVGTGCSLATFSFFVKPLEAAMGWSRTELMLSFSLVWSFTAIGGLFAGRLIERYGVRLVVSTGGVLMCASFLLLSQMTSLWHYYIAYAIIGIGISAVGHIPSSYLVSQWFYRRRGLALGIMSLGMSLAAVLYAPLAGVYLIPTFGWQGTYLALAGITAIFVFPMSVFVIRTKPADKGLFPDGAAAPPAPKITAKDMPDTGRWTTARLLGNPTFWMMAISLIFVHNTTGIMQSQVPHYSDLGFPVSVSALAYSTFSIAASSGTLFFGWLCDRIPVKSAWVFGLLAICSAIVIFININTQTPPWAVCAFAAIFGFGVSSFFPTMSVLASSYFGMASYGTVYGMLSFFQATGAAMGPLYAGFIYDTTGEYQTAFITFLAMVVISLPLILLTPRPKA